MGPLSTQTALTLSTSSMTTGTLLSLANTAAGATSTGTVLNVANATTGPGFGIASAMTGASNTGYAGYFNNTATTGYGIYAPGAAPNYFAGNVGIGTTSPSQALEIGGYGNIQIDSTGASHGLLIFDTWLSRYNSVLNVDGQPLEVNGNLYVMPNGGGGGSVGIGTTTPGREF